MFRPSRTPEPNVNRRSFLLAASSVALAGCAAGGSSGSAGSGSPAPAPVWRTGDRWTYDARDGFRAPVTWEETHEVLSVAADGIALRVTQRGPTVNNTRIERLSAPGIVTVGAAFDNETRRFATPLERYRFPLTPGERWNQVGVANFNEMLGREDPLNRTVVVRDWTKVTTPAGAFDAIVMRVFMQINLNDPFNFPTQCNYELWWAAAAGAMVRETRQATYRPRGDGRSSIEIRAQNAELVLTSYPRAG
jgi:hypothetical protein